MRHKDNYMYNYFYKITNNLNGNFYYGIHSTNNLDDGYMGSGLKLKRAYKKYGIENFSKEIIKFFNTREELSDYEATVVTEQLINDCNCYNISLGGEQLKCIGTFSAFDIKNNIWRRITDDEYKKMPENFITGVGYDKVLVKRKDNINGKYIIVSKDEYYNHKDLYITNLNYYNSTHIKVFKKDNPDKIFTIHINEFDENIYTKADYNTKGKIVVKDKAGKCFSVSLNDPRYISGELIAAYTGYKWSVEQKNKLKEKFAKIGHQCGIKNSQYGTKWINKDGVVKKVKKEELEKYLSENWKLGMKFK